MRLVKFHAYKGTSLMSRLIKFRTLGEYSHIAIEIEGIVYEAWTSDGCNGVVMSTNPLFYHKDGTQFDTFIVPMHDTNYDKWKEFIKLQVGKKYDWRAIFNFVINWDKSNPDKWFCSELADTFFNYEIERYKPETKLVSPEKFVDKIRMYLYGLQSL